MMIAAVSPASLVSIGTETPSLPQFLMERFELSESDDEAVGDDDESVVFAAVKEDENTVSTAAVSSVASSQGSIEDEATEVDEDALVDDPNEVDVDDLCVSSKASAAVVDIDEVDVDEIGVDEVDVDDLIAQTETKFGGHRSSIAIATLQDDDSEEEESTSEDSQQVPTTPPPMPAPQCFHRSASMPTTRSSFKLSSLNEPIPVKEGAAWKQLPKPDLSKIHFRRAISMPETEPIRRKGTVTFTTIEIRNYALTLGDNPSVSYGPPIQLDWVYDSLPLIQIDDWEGQRGPRRQLRQMNMSYYQRMHLLQNVFGIPEEDLKLGEKKANKDKFKRAITKAFLPAQIFEDAAQSAGRKTKRLFGKGRRNTVV